MVDQYDKIIADSSQINEIERCKNDEECDEQDIDNISSILDKHDKRVPSENIAQNKISKSIVKTNGSNSDKIPSNSQYLHSINKKYNNKRLGSIRQCTDRDSTNNFEKSLIEVLRDVSCSF